MSLVLIGLAVLLYWRRRKIEVLFITVALLALGLLGGSSWFLYLGSFSPERVALDRVDQQIMHIVDRERRIRFLVDRRYKPVEAVPAERLEDALDLAHEYLTVLTRPVVAAQELERLRQRFRVGVTPTLELDRRVLLGIVSRLGLDSAAAALLLAVCYLAARRCSSPETTANTGFLGTLAVLVGSLFVLPVPHPLGLFSLLILAIVAVVLYFSCRQESARLLEFVGGAILVLAVALFVLAARGYEFYGENDIRRKVTAMDQRLPRIQAVAQALGEAVEPLAESMDRPPGLEDAVSELWSLSTISLLRSVPSKNNSGTPMRVSRAWPGTVHSIPTRRNSSFSAKIPSAKFPLDLHNSVRST